VHGLRGCAVLAQNHFQLLHYLSLCLTTTKIITSHTIQTLQGSQSAWCRLLGTLRHRCKKTASDTMVCCCRNPMPTVGIMRILDTMTLTNTHSIKLPSHPLLHMLWCNLAFHHLPPHCVSQILSHHCSSFNNCCYCTGSHTTQHTHCFSSYWVQCQRVSGCSPHYGWYQSICGQAWAEGCSMW
jgi:hypothetical protein